MKLFDKLFGSSDKNYKYKTTVFFICLSASSIIWLFSKLSDTYSSQINIPITTKNVPDGKILLRKSDSLLNLTLNDQGFKLLWIRYFKGNKKFTINLSDISLIHRENAYTARINTNDWAEQFLGQFNLAGRVTSISPDSIDFVFEERIFKKVPVEPDITINFKKQYFAYDTLKVIPDTVTISGLARNIANIDHIKTLKANYNDVSSSINTSIELKLPQNVDLEELPSRRVVLTLHVEKFTEAQISVPITPIHQPANLRVRIFPDEVSISYIVALKDYRLITPDMFSMQVDLLNIQNIKEKKLEVIPSGLPRNVKINRIHPREVEYLILK
jgi:hypothetical protein